MKWLATVALAATALAVAGALSACSPLSLVNAISPGGTDRSVETTAFGPNPRHNLSIYRPAQGAHKSPVIVFFYGGNWVSGERDDYEFVGRSLAARGFVVVIPDVRLYPQAGYPGFLDDSARAVAWTARRIAEHGGDPGRIFVMGHSAGAYNAAMVALDPRWLRKQGTAPSILRGWIGLAGPYNFLPIENETTRKVFPYPDTRPDSQPINHVSAIAPPALLIAARNDRTVEPVRNSGAMADRLRATGVPVREAVYDNVNHATLVATLSSSLRRLAPTLDAVEDFVRSDGGRTAARPDQGR
ncbi:alpha/beta hydrolase [Telluria beijingensis]|uniref:alpha/beta hydrolase n=1 Tax=Telluria beijingensis TaxID=3068633 RepID=UPI0027961B45|nr:alpha/beta hydrolase [Massilia sp. REN29]